ncbi:hypothetical protein AB4Z51_34205 [Bradyrhizobium sp. 2TAF36]|uniref:hypothetical protein n=1 Tax=Bradyrhizobium sp. 2TAF36 TaxID=3233016 RepID=UPI003F93ED58
MKKIDRVELKKSRARKTVGVGVLNHLAARVLVAEQEAAEAAANLERMAKIAEFWKAEALQERASAAVVAGKQRLMLGKTWKELIVNEHEDLGDEDLDDDDDDLDDDELDDDEDDLDDHELDDDELDDDELDDDDLDDEE